jgi:multidrug resistance protein
MVAGPTVITRKVRHPGPNHCSNRATNHSEGIGRAEPRFLGRHSVFAGKHHCRPLYGKLGDMYGRKIVLQIAIVIFLVGSVLCGLSQTTAHLVLARGLQGVGGGGLIVTATAVVGDLVPPRERGRYQGIFGAVFGVATIIGPPLGGLLVEHLSWRWIFYINLPTGAVTLFLVGTILRSQKSAVCRINDPAALGRTYRLGCLHTLPRPVPLEAWPFFDELRRRGFIEGRNLTIEYRA